MHVRLGHAAHWRGPGSQTSASARNIGSLRLDCQAICASSRMGLRPGTALRADRVMVAMIEGSTGGGWAAVGQRQAASRGAVATRVMWIAVRTTWPASAHSSAYPMPVIPKACSVARVDPCMYLSLTPHPHRRFRTGASGGSARSAWRWVRGSSTGGAAGAR